MKRVLSIQDISCVGKCALGAALPVISAMGVECCVLPTAVLSTHTAFKHVHMRDMTEEIPAFAEAWAQEGIHFDAILTGYLGSVKQVSAVSDLIRRFRTPETRVIIDPVMGDHGKLYRGFDDAFVREMRALAAQADILLPNATEAALLTGLPYPETADGEQAETLLNGLMRLGPRCAVLTGVCDGDQLGAASMAEEGVMRLHTGPRLPGSYFGTGDLFAAVLTGALVQGAALEDGMALAVDFVAAAIRNTLNDPEKRFYGTSFEPSLGWLAEQVRGIREKA